MIIINNEISYKTRRNCYEILSYQIKSNKIYFKKHIFNFRMNICIHFMQGFTRKVKLVFLLLLGVLICKSLVLLIFQLEF